MVSAVRLDRQPFDRIVRCRPVANVLSMGFVVRRCFQCSAGKSIAILGQAFRRLVVLRSVALDEGVERSLGVGLRLGHPNLLQRAFRLRLLALWQLGEHVRSLLDPTALLAGRRPNLADSFPKAERAVGDHQLRPHIEPAPLQIEQPIAPIMRTLARPIGISTLRLCFAEHLKTLSHRIQRLLKLFPALLKNFLQLDLLFLGQFFVFQKTVP